MYRTHHFRIIRTSIGPFLLFLRLEKSTLISGLRLNVNLKLNVQLTLPCFDIIIVESVLLGVNDESYES